jgi:DNA-binding response OmpR family regulator
MSPINPDFILIDDSRLDCFISQKIIISTCQTATIQSFMDAENALKFIINRPPGSHSIPTIILLDIQMPVMNGFGFATAFEKLSETIVSQYVIYMVSSSTNESDRIRIGNYSCIKQLYHKPLTKNIIQEVINNCM